MDRLPARARLLAATRSRVDHRAHSGCGSPPITGTTDEPPGHSARGLRTASVTRGRSHASTSTERTRLARRKVSTAVHRAMSGPSPGGSSLTNGRPETPGPTSKATGTTARNAFATTTAHGVPPINMDALSKPIRLLSPPVSRTPAIGGSSCSSPRRVPSPSSSRREVVPGKQLPSEGMSLAAHEWTTRFAEKLGTDPPSEEELTWLLELAGTAAHASERTAAPVSCWLAARAGIGPVDALRAALQLADELATGD